MGCHCLLRLESVRHSQIFMKWLQCAGYGSRHLGSIPRKRRQMLPSNVGLEILSSLVNAPPYPLLPLMASHLSVDSLASGSPPVRSADFSLPFSEGNWSKEKGVAGSGGLTQWGMQAGEEAHHLSSCKAHLQGHSVLDLRNLVFIKLASAQQP